MNVLTYGIIETNGFDVDCNLLPPAGSIICLPETCGTYRLDTYERCDSIAADAEITPQQLLECNPIVIDFCFNFYGWGWNICVE
jgi:hypothetical protein